jgi:hypothetical protein
LDDAADRERAAYQTALEPRLGPDGDLSPVADYAGKHIGTTCRLAGILHVADHAQDIGNMPAEIPLLTFKRATTIADYYLEHAIAAFQAMGADETTELAKRMWQWIVRGRRLLFTAYEVRRATHATPEEAAPALAALIERSLIRALPEPPPTGGRPASQPYATNPRALP